MENTVKIFCIGFHKTGTTSMGALCRELGYLGRGAYKVWDTAFVNALKQGDLSELKEVAEHYEAFWDNPWPVFYKELDQWYPSSKFILTVRDSSSWIASIVNHFGNLENPSSAMREFIYGYGNPAGHEKLYIERFERHNREVLKYFQERPQKLLVVDLNERDALKKTCRFLGKEITTLKTMPHKNRRLRQRRLSVELLWQWLYDWRWLRGLYGSSAWRIPRLRQEPIIIGGCARSGTTLILSLLSCHPHIVAIDEETSAFYPRSHPHKRKPQKPQAIKDPPAFAVRKIYKWLLTHPLPASSVRWCEKTPKNVLAYERIIAYYRGRVKILNMVRDGRDVVTSYHPIKPMEFFVSPQRWMYDVSHGMRAEQYPQMLTIRYEDLILDYETTLKRIFEFVGEEDYSPLLSYPEGATVLQDGAWFEPAKPLSEKSIGRWKQAKYAEVVKRLLNTPGAIEYLRHYRYLK
ncbi:MAG: sulfotransferase [bacterium]|nr:sulfotransferase [bacterium]